MFSVLLFILKRILYLYVVGFIKQYRINNWIFWDFHYKSIIYSFDLLKLGKKILYLDLQSFVICGLDFIEYCCYFNDFIDLNHHSSLLFVWIIHYIYHYDLHFCFFSNISLGLTFIIYNSWFDFYAI